MRAIDRLLRNRPKAGGLSLAGKIKALFANGEQGWWYDPSNFSTLFQDSAGTTPVTAVEQPVGLQLDLSKGLVLGPQLVTNGDFATDTWWSKGTGCTISGGSANFAAASGYVLSRLNVSGIAVGGFYEVTFTVTNYVSGSIRPYLGATPTFGTSVSANGTYTVRFGPTAGAEIGFNSASAFTGSIDNVSIKAVTGNHRFQSTSANRPVVSARVNLLTKTEQFDDAAWTKQNVTLTTNATQSPIGTGNGTSLIPTAVLGQFRIYRNPDSGISAINFIYVKTDGYTKVALRDAGGTAGMYAAFDLSSARVIDAGSSSSASIVSAGGGWFKISAVFTTAANQRFSLHILSPSYSSGVVDVTWTANGTSGIYVWGADLRHTNIGVGLPVYQRVNTSTDYDTTGFPVYIKPNGSNQFMVTNSINFSSTDKMTVWQGVRKLSDAARGMIAELSTNATNNGTFAVTAPNASAASNYATVVTGSAVNIREFATYSAPITNVLAMSMASASAGSGAEVTMRINNVVNAGTVGPNFGASTGNYGNYPAYFYMRAGTSLPFNGNDYGSIARGAASTAAQITAGETYINSKTKAY